jgi:hypothetical protein
VTPQKCSESLPDTNRYDNPCLLDRLKQFQYHSRSFLVIGSPGESMKDDRNNESKYSSFDMPRRSFGGIEILAYDELHERFIHCEELGIAKIYALVVDVLG